MADQTRRKADGNQPISRHPLFPAIVALWFGALFGLASIAIKPELIERVVLAAGIASIVPMAAPPLGATSRILVAIALIGLGALIGVVVARRIARPEAQAGERLRWVAMATESALAGSDEDGIPAAAADEGADSGPARLVSRRDAGSPAPTAEPSILNVAEFDLAGYEDEPACMDEAETGFAPPPVDAESYDADSSEPEEHEASAAPAMLHSPEVAEEHAPAEDRAVSNRLFDTYSRELATRAAQPERPEVALGPRAAERIASAELDTLSLVELLERLALAMARRREEIAAQPLGEASPEPEMEPVPAKLHASDDVAQESEPATEMTELPRMPAALRPVAYGSPAEDDALPGYIPPRHIGLTPDADLPRFAQAPSHLETFHGDEGGESEAEESEDEESEALEQGYSSLLNLSRSAFSRQSFARIDEPETDKGILPVVIFPGEEAREAEDSEASPQADGAADAQRPFDAPEGRSPHETEKALREALATLQRMSGAA